MFKIPDINNVDFSNKMPRMPAETVFNTLNADGTLTTEIKMWPVWDEKITGPQHVYCNNDCNLTITGAGNLTWVDCQVNGTVTQFQIPDSEVTHLKLNFSVSGVHNYTFQFHGSGNTVAHVVKAYKPVIEMPATATVGTPFLYNITGAMPNKFIKINQVEIGATNSDGSHAASMTIHVPGMYDFEIEIEGSSLTDQCIFKQKIEILA